MIYMLLTLVLALFQSTTSVSFKVEDASGASLKDELIIVQDLDHHEQEVFRSLTDQDGVIASAGLQPGLYRAIAIAPYTAWQTEVKEFWVRDRPLRVTLRIKPAPTHGYGDVLVLNAARVSIRVLESSGRPAASTSILARDALATPYLERWYTTDNEGKANIELVADPLVLVVVRDDTLTTTEISKKNESPIIKLH